MPEPPDSISSESHMRRASQSPRPPVADVGGSSYPLNRTAGAPFPRVLDLAGQAGGGPPQADLAAPAAVPDGVGHDLVDRQDERRPAAAR